MSGTAKLKQLHQADIERAFSGMEPIYTCIVNIMIHMQGGYCDDLENPIGYARRCMNMSRVFAEATSHFLAQAQRQALEPKAKPDG